MFPVGFFFVFEFSLFFPFLVLVFRVVDVWCVYWVCFFVLYVVEKLDVEETYDWMSINYV